MPVLSKRFVLAASSLALSCAVAPLLLYAVGLLVADGRPAIPAKLASDTQQKEVWAEAKGTGELRVTVLNPYTYCYSVIGSNGRATPSALLAWRVARAHLREHHRLQGSPRWHLSGTALTIWLTRNWSVEELTSKLVELRERNAA